MNTSSNAFRILCYGDSNTWGYVPGTGERYDATVRWTGILQKALGDKFEVIEEGLNGRTTTIDDPENEGKNGEPYLKSCLRSHAPLDLVVLMLGTNDLKKRFARTPQEITQGVEQLISIIDNSEYHYMKEPKVILLSPPLVDESVTTVQERYETAEEKSKQLGKLYKEVAKRRQSIFIDMAEYVFPSKRDGYHLDPESHKKIAEVLKDAIIKLVT